MFVITVIRQKDLTLKINNDSILSNDVSGGNEVVKVFTLRLPDDLHGKINKEAHKQSLEKRKDVSMHSLVLNFLVERFGKKKIRKAKK